MNFNKANSIFKKCFLYEINKLRYQLVGNSNYFYIFQFKGAMEL